VNHIATGKALSPGGELLPPHIEDSNGDGNGSEINGDSGDGDGDRWRWLRGHFPIPVGCQNRDFYPLKFVFDSGGTAELFWEKCRLF
jgi:hypothetical protein